MPYSQCYSNETCNCQVLSSVNLLITKNLSITKHEAKASKGVCRMTLKYYLYISDTKVDMLFPQIPGNILKKIGGELHINLGIFNVNLVYNNVIGERATQRNQVVL